MDETLFIVVFEDEIPETIREHLEQAHELEVHALGAASIVLAAPQGTTASSLIQMVVPESARPLAAVAFELQGSWGGFYHSSLWHFLEKATVQKVHS